MVANPGGITSSLTAPDGTPIFVIYEFFDPATYAMRDRTITTSTGTKTGALIVDNMTGKVQRVVVTDSETGAVKTFNIPLSGSVLTAAQLAALPAPNGPINVVQDLSGIQPSIVA